MRYARCQRGVPFVAVFVGGGHRNRHNWKMVCPRTWLALIQQSLQTLSVAMDVADTVCSSATVCMFCDCYCSTFGGTRRVVSTRGASDGLMVVQLAPWLW